MNYFPQEQDEDAIPFDAIPDDPNIPLPPAHVHLNVLRRELLKRRAERLSPRRGLQMLLGDSPNDTPLNLFEREGRLPMRMDGRSASPEEEREVKKRMQYFQFRRGNVEGRSL